jgi:cytochrome P450
VSELAELACLEVGRLFADAAALYCRLQVDAPVFVHASRDVLVLSRHADIRHSLQHHEISSSVQDVLLGELSTSARDYRKRPIHELFDSAEDPMVQADPPLFGVHHLGSRRLV